MNQVFFNPFISLILREINALNYVPVHTLKTISYNHIKANDPDSMLLCVELKMKTQRKNTDWIRDILKREMFKALSIK